MNIEHESEVTKQAPLMQTICWLCGGTGWREMRIDDIGTAHGDRCGYCAGLGYVWIEMDDLRKTAEEARRRLTRARYMP